MKTGIGSHQSAQMMNDEWFTPKHIIDALGKFDLDPCTSINRPWDTAKKHYTKIDDGLSLPWNGRVWCNPPYGRIAEKWLGKLAIHGNGIALIFARTETEMFFNQVWGKADGIFFIKGRLHFYFLNGEKAKTNSGGPSCLIAYGVMNSAALRTSNIAGKYIDLR